MFNFFISTIFLLSPVFIVGEKLPEISGKKIAEEKLKFFVSKIAIWDYFNIFEATYKAYAVGEKSRLLTKYYSESFEKYYGSGDFFCLCLRISGVVLSRFLCWKKISYRFCFYANW